ncbi:unnamed protein product, partial [Mesorhabditis belari]|uniref:Uncharacterized protein n=1 Tax=Mesorhabditis belari TaxID=2138241 RepID=A0AAF3EMF7_9BILA
MPLITECAKRCYSGSKGNYQSRICGLGESDDKYVCQKFVCEGGKSPEAARVLAVKPTIAIIREPPNRGPLVRVPIISLLFPVVLR